MNGIENVLLVTVDCLRADRFREGIDAGLLPTFADLDARGTTFDDAFTVANTTDPSLTSILTGAYPMDHGVVENGWGLPADRPVAAERFREAGYNTFGVVSVDHLADDHSGLGCGFDRYFDGSAYGTLYPILSRIYDTKGFNAVFGAVKDRGVGPYTVKRFLRRTGLIDLHCRPARKVTADARSGLEAVEEPFFGWVHYFDLHEPRNAPPGLRADHDEYTAAMIHADDHVGRLLDDLEERGLAEETLVVLTGDHGEALGDHGYTGHGRTLYDEELHVPLVFAHDSLPAGTVGRQARTVDIVPTLLSLSGLDPLGPAGRPLFADGAPLAEDRPLFAMAYPTFEDRVALRTEGWKLVRDRGAGDEELYDLADDPGERRDLAGEHPERRGDLAAELDDWLDEFDAVERQQVDSGTEEMLADLGYRE
ncbi:sulfatase [Saliphagus sp. LR7]|uniref:sulfatase n=1 Tax=Saliphagus sp. LR7 TaxID=2282654 RepID=UPI000DF77A03|nr:sulfatase [Saliphagus sp. LR7]